MNKVTCAETVATDWASQIKCSYPFFPNFPFFSFVCLALHLSDICLNQTHRIRGQGYYDRLLNDRGGGYQFKFSVRVTSCSFYFSFCFLRAVSRVVRGSFLATWERKSSEKR